MARYIDGFVLPVPRARLTEYERLAKAVAEIWKEYGALDYLEYVGDDMNLEGTRSFTDLVAATKDEPSCLGGWYLIPVRHVIWQTRRSRLTQGWPI